MTGTVVFTGLDANGNRTFGVKMNSELFPADADDVLLRDLEIGDPVTFMTERDSGKALIQHPPKVIGCERAIG